MKELDKAITALEEAKAKIDAMLAQNNGLKTADDAQNNGKTPEVAPDVTPEENSAEVSGFVEYPIFKDDGRYWCNVLHLGGDRWNYECALYELPSIVGFAGVQYAEDVVTWYTHIGYLYDNTLGGVCGVDLCDVDMKPATPFKARFWIKTPPLNDK